VKNAGHKTGKTVGEASFVLTNFAILSGLLTNIIHSIHIDPMIPMENPSWKTHHVSLSSHGKSSSHESKKSVIPIMKSEIPPCFG
jgi:hypothetical protein